MSFVPPSAASVSPSSQGFRATKEVYELVAQLGDGLPATRTNRPEGQPHRAGDHDLRRTEHRSRGARADRPRPRPRRQPDRHLRDVCRAAARRDVRLDRADHRHLDSPERQSATASSCAPRWPDPAMRWGSTYVRGGNNRLDRRQHRRGHRRAACSGCRPTTWICIRCTGPTGPPTSSAVWAISTGARRRHADRGDVGGLERTGAIGQGSPRRASPTRPRGACIGTCTSPHERGLPRVVSIQNPYSLLNRSFEVGLAEMAIKEDVGLLAYSPLGFGVLTGKFLDGARPPAARVVRWSRFVRYSGAHRPSRRRRPTWRLPASMASNPAQMALAFVNRQPLRDQHADWRHHDGTARDQPGKRRGAALRRGDAGHRGGAPHPPNPCP